MEKKAEFRILVTGMNHDGSEAWHWFPDSLDGEKDAYLYCDTLMQCVMRRVIMAMDIYQKT